MKPIVASLALNKALIDRHAEYLQIADTNAADLGVPAGDPHFVWGSAMLMLLTEVFLNVHAALRILGAKPDHLDKLVHAALERAKAGIATQDAAKGEAGPS